MSKSTTTPKVNKKSASYKTLAQRYTRQLAVIEEINQIIGSNKQTETALAAVLNRLLTSQNYQAGQIYRVSPTGHDLWLYLERGSGTKPVAPNNDIFSIDEQNIISDTARSCAPIYIPDISKGPYAFHMPNGINVQINSEVAVPIQYGHEVLGALRIQSERPGDFEPADISFLTSVASLLASAVHNTQTISQLQNDLQEIKILYNLQREADLAQHAQEGDTGIWRGYEYDGQAVKPAQTISAAAKQILTKEQTEPALLEDQKHNQLVAPIKLYGETIGVIGVEDSQDDPEWLEDNLSFLQEASTQVALAIESSRLLQQTQKRTKELSILFEASRQLSETVELQRIYQILTTQIINYLQADICRLSLIDNTRTHFETIVQKSRNQAGEVTESAAGIGSSDEIAVLQRMLKQPKITITHLDDPDLDDSTRIYLETHAERPIGTHAIFPITVRHHLIGVLQVSHFDRRRKYSENELQLGQAILSQVTVAIENAQLFEQTESALSETQKLYMISRALVESSDLEDTFSIVLETIKSYGIDRVSISLLDRSQSGTIDTVTIVASWDRDSEMILPVGSKISADMFSLVNAFAQPPFQPLISEDLSKPEVQDERMDDAFRIFMYEGLGAATMFSTPMFLGAEYKGVLSISTRRPHKYTQQETRIYQTLADQTIIAIENYRLFEEVRRERDQAALLSEIAQSLSQAATINRVQETLLSYTEEFGATYGEIYVTNGHDFVSMATTIPQRRQKSAAELNNIARLVLTSGIEAQVIYSKTTVTCNRSAIDWTIEGVPDSEDMNSLVSTPFFSQRSQLKGAITFYHPQEDGFSSEQISLLESLVIQVVSALENVWLLEQTTSALNETEILYRATGDFSRAQYPQELLNILGQNIAAGSEANIDYMALTLVSNLTDDGTPEKLTIIAEWDINLVADNWTDLFTVPIIPAEFAFVGQLKGDGPQLFQTNNLNRKTRDNIDTYLGKARTILAIPLTVGRNWLGVLFIASRSRDVEFKESLLNQVNTLTGQMAVIIQNLQLVEETQQNLYYSEILSHLSQELLTSDSRSSIFNLSLDAIAATEPGRGAAIFMYDQIEMGVELEMVAIWDNPFTSDNPNGWPTVPPGARFSTAELGLEALLKTGQTVTALNPQEDKRFSPTLCQLLTMMQINSLVAVPIWLKREVNGFFLVGNHQATAFPGEMIRHYEDIARQTSVALENHRLLDEAQHRATLLQTAAEVSQAATSYLDLETLLSQSVDLIRDRFEYYHVSIFLLDEYNKYAVVEASTGEVGRKMLAMKHKLEVGGKSIVGTATGTGRPRIALDVGADAVWFNNPLLPDTHSEMALPLVARGQVIGALDVQSTKSGAFTQGDITILQSMANQLANAIEAARSFQESKEALKEVRKLHEHYLREQWQAFLKEQKTATSYRLSEAGLVETSQALWWPEMEQAIETKKPVVISPPLTTPDTHQKQGGKKDAASPQSNAATVIAPLSLQNEVVIGTLDLEIPDKNQLWAEDNLSIIEAVMGQAAQAIEEARLFEETQTARETAEALYRVARTLVTAETEEEMYHTVLDEILSALGLEQGGILFFEEDRKFGRLHALFEAGQPVKPGLRFPIENNLSYERLIKSKQPLAIEDVATDPLLATVREINLERGIASLLLVPIIIEDEVVGAMGVDALGEKHNFNEAEINLSRAMADQLSIMLQNRRLIAETRRNALQLQTSADVGRVATSILDQDVMLGEAVELIRDRFGFYHVQIFLVDAEKQFVMLNKSTDAIGQQLLRDRHRVVINSPNVVGQAAAQRKPLVVRDLEAVGGEETSSFDIPEKHKEMLPNTKAELVVPLQVGDTLIGLLDVHSTSPMAFTPEDIATMETLGAQLAIATQNARVFREQQETAERLKEMDKLKTQFLANMSHELRTPLNSIIGFSRVILKGIDGPLTELQKADLTSIHNSGQHLLGLINNMLDVAKIEAGKMELNMEEIEIEPIIKSVISTARALVKDKPVELLQEVQENMATVWADPTRMRQIILNLVSNACKFTEEGEVTLRAYTDDKKFTISVSDTGIGIPQEKLSSVFEEFTQVDASTTRKVGGTGLGLPISRHFVEMHGGTIWVESALGKGSTFSFSIPVKPWSEERSRKKDPAHEPAAVSEKLMGESKGFDGRGKIIMAIDDDPNVVNLYQRFLEKQGYTIIGVNNSKDVFPAIDQYHPTAILLDVLMPDKDGWGVLGELKDNESTQDIPVIICSIVSDKNRGFSLGAADYLTKPIVEADLVKALRRLDRQTKAQVKVLVIDDEADDVLLIRRILEAESNYVVLEAENGKKGLELVSDQHPDLIVLDLTMPEMDGFTVVEKLKNNEETRSIPIIIVSAKELTSTEKEFLTGEVEVLLQKGLFSESELLEDVSQALEQIYREREVV